MKLLLIFILINIANASDLAWKLSIATLSAGQCFDAVSSWNQPEANPILNSKFKLVAFKSSATAAVLAPQFKAKNKKFWTIINFTVGGIYTCIVIRNYKVRGYKLFIQN